jgi:CRP/FNR family cyclic AMP-dependent transcriptional regulator
LKKYWGVQDVKSFNAVHLDSSAWLMLLPQTVREKLLDACVVQDISRGKVLYRFGDIPDGIYGLVSGCIHMETLQSDHGPTMLNLFHAGSWLGEVEMFSNMHRLTTLTARRNCRYRYLSSNALKKMGNAHPEVWKALGHLAAEKLCLAVAAIDDLSNRSSYCRLVAILLRLSGARIDPLPNHVVTDLDITQSELAQMSNLSRSMIFELLNEMENEGLIARQYGKLQIRNVAELKRALHSR